MARYKNFDRSQGLFLAVSLGEQRIPGSIDHTLKSLIDHFDLSTFDATFHNDRTGAPAYPPGVMLTISCSCYSRGSSTNRPITMPAKLIA
ncbi:MAG: hypothetical protein LBF75_04515 [Treponema sp.]|nr:hypothetical protein [Treponema sp.]